MTWFPNREGFGDIKGKGRYIKHAQGKNDANSQEHRLSLIASRILGDLIDEYYFVREGKKLDVKRREQKELTEAERPRKTTRGMFHDQGQKYREGAFPNQATDPPKVFCGEEKLGSLVPLDLRCMHRYCTK